MNKTTKTFLIILSMSISALITPLFGQWYQQQTGMIPFAFYGVSAIGFVIFGLISIINIWEK
jgi:hypothetical protein